VTTRVRVITEEAPAIVLSYPRETDPVFGADFTEIAQLPPHFEQEFTLSAGIDLLVAEMPQDAVLAEEATDAAINFIANAVEGKEAA
jgi:hypothetical protein